MVGQGEDAEALRKGARGIATRYIAGLHYIIVGLDATHHKHRMATKHMALVALALFTVARDSDPTKGRNRKDINIAI